MCVCRHQTLSVMMLFEVCWQFGGADSELLLHRICVFTLNNLLCKTIKILRNVLLSKVQKKWLSFTAFNVIKFGLFSCG